MTTNTIFRDAESGGLNAFIDRPNADTAPDFHLNADMVTAIVQHELGKLGLWWAKEQRALVVTAPHAIPEHTPTSRPCRPPHQSPARPGRSAPEPTRTQR